MIRDNFLDMSKIIKDKKVLKLFRAVEAHGGTLRFVGGAVRDALKGIEGFDLDLATDLSPDELVEACADKGLRTIPVGIKFGTVGVLIGDKVVEVTSLRKDIKTDGRRAVVEFTDNWEVDASRRDLTINAVYADEKGNVFDYYNGIEDLEKGVVRFIGKPEQRIQEDYLRIMRFFRFYSIFGIGEIDKKALKACIEFRDGLKNVSIERVCDELKKIMLTKNVVKVLNIMFENGIFDNFFRKMAYPDELEFLVEITENINIPNKVLTRLFMLYIPDAELANNLALRFKLTKKQREIFVALAANKVDLNEFFDSKSLRKLVYRYGKEFCCNKLVIELAIAHKNIDNLEEILNEINNSEIPIFPVKGRDILDAGIDNPHKIGGVLANLEKKWLESDFKLSKEELLS